MLGRVLRHWWLVPALLGLAARPALAGPNLVANGTFGTGSFASWNLTNTGTVTSNAVVIQTDNVGRSYPTGAYGEAIPLDPLLTGSPDAASGWAAYFSTDTGAQTLSQTLTLSAGTYAIGFDVFVPANGYRNAHDATFTGTVGGTSLLSSASVAAIGTQYGVNTWVSVTAQAQIATAGTYLTAFTFSGQGVTAKDILVDRVYLTEVSQNLANGGTPVPEPGAALVFASGLVGLALARRMRRQA